MAALVTLPTVDVEVDPGTAQELVVRVRNTGTIVDRFTLEVLGDASPWATVAPDTLSLFPGAEDTARIVFTPPQGPSPRAGRVVFGVRVRSSENPSDSVVEEGSVTVKPYPVTSATIVPQTSRGSRSARHDVHVTNGGNVPVEVAVEPSDPDRLLAFETRPARLALEPGAMGSSRLNVKPNETFLNGPPQSHPFVVAVTGSGQAPFEIRASMLQRSILPPWTPRALMIAGAAAGLAVVAFIAGVGRTPEPEPSPSIALASPTAAPTQAPPSEAPAASEAPPSVAAPSVAAPSAPASPTATPEPSFDISFVEPAFQAASYNPICADDQCQETAITGMRLLATLQEATYNGTGLLDTTTIPDGTMAIILEADGMFGWQSAAGAGETDRFVVDFTPLANGTGPAYGVVDQEGTPAKRFVLPEGLTRQIVGMLFTPPGPAPSFDIFLPPGQWLDELDRATVVAP